MKYWLKLSSPDPSTISGWHGSNFTQFKYNLNKFKEFESINQSINQSFNQSFINHEKASRAKTDYPELRIADCFQYSYFIVIQQWKRSFWISHDSGLSLRSLDAFHHCIFCNHKKIWWVVSHYLPLFWFISHFCS